MNGSAPNTDEIIQRLRQDFIESSLDLMESIDARITEMIEEPTTFPH